MRTWKPLSTSTDLYILDDEKPRRAYPDGRLGGAPRSLIQILPVCVRHFGKWLNSTEEVSGSSIQSRNNVTDAKNSRGKLLPVCVRHLGYWRKSLEVALDSPQQSRKQQVGRESRLQKLFPIWCRHLGKWLKSIEPSSNNRNPSRSHEGNPGNCSENALPVCCHHGRKWSKSAGTGGIHQEPTSVNHPYTIPLTSPRSARLVKIPSPHRQHSTTVSRAELCAMNNPPLNLTHFRSTDVIHFRSAGFSDGRFLSDLTSSWRELQFQGWSWGGASVPRMLKPVSTRK